MVDCWGESRHGANMEIMGTQSEIQVVAVGCNMIRMVIEMSDRSIQGVRQNDIVIGRQDDIWRCHVAQDLRDLVNKPDAWIKMPIEGYSSTQAANMLCVGNSARICNNNRVGDPIFCQKLATEPHNKAADHASAK